jgi:hypothetical protein
LISANLFTLRLQGLIPLIRLVKTNNCDHEKGFHQIDFVYGWLVKTTHDGVKVKNNDIVLNGKATRLKINCPSGDSCSNFAFHLPNSIKKGTYQIVYRADIGDDLNVY